MTRTPPKLVLLGIGLLLMGGFLPLWYLVMRATEAGPEAFKELVFRPRNWELFKNTMLLVVGVLATSVLVAYPLAWLTTRSSMRGKRLWALVGVLPLAFPSYLMAYAILSMGGNIGAIAQLTDWVFPRFSGYWGAVAILSLCNFPYLFFNLRAALLTLDPALEDVAYSLGYSSRGVIFRVLLPQLRPALLSGSMLIALHVLSDFAAVSMMRYETLSYVLYTQYNSGFNPAYGASIAIMLVVITGLFLLIETWFLRRLRFDKAGSTGARAITPRPLGIWAPVAYGFTISVLFVSVLAPVASMLFWVGKADLSMLMPELVDALKGSVFASMPAALISTMLVIPIAYLSIRMPSPVTRLLERSTYLGYAIPSLAFALGLVYFSLKLAPSLYQTLFLLIYAYTFHYLAEAVGPIRSALYQTSPRVEEAAQSLGYSRLRTIFTVTLPLIRNGMLISTAFIFLSCMKELHLTLILSPLGYNTLALNVWSFIEEAFFAEAAPFAITILLFSGLFVGLLLIQEKRIT
jgi:iron(III) transport system permease protein